MATSAPWKLEWFGLGNELWGCGGNMRPEYAADVTKRYSTFVKLPKDTKTMKIASGATHNADPWAEYNWTEVMMREASKEIDGTGVHYYTFPGGRRNKGSATDFDEEAWARTLSKTLLMDGYLDGHEKIMDKYDPSGKKILAVDEWGTWYDPTPGSNPGFLQQQNTLRDAVVAALNINIFAKHARRVKMANIAQMVNVLQAMILTDGPKMVLTPTYQCVRDVQAVPGRDLRADRSQVELVQQGSMGDPGGQRFCGTRHRRPSLHRAGERRSQPCGIGLGRPGRRHRHQRHRPDPDRRDDAGA